VAVEGWRPVEELVQWGFAHAPVVMANEAHNGLARSIRTREIGVRMIRAAHEAGVRRLAMEALNWPGRDTPGPISALPADTGGYLAQPDMRRLIGTALDLGWTLWAYDAIIEREPDSDPAEMLSIEFTNWREREQAVAFDGEPRPWVRELLAALGETLAAHGGTAGILRDQAPEPLNCRTYVDALVVSTDNALTGPLPPPRLGPARGDSR
jgi:hypothetical protein